jgi:hypothetical protein
MYGVTGKRSKSTPTTIINTLQYQHVRRHYTGNRSSSTPIPTFTASLQVRDHGRLQYQHVRRHYTGNSSSSTPIPTCTASLHRYKIKINSNTNVYGVTTLRIQTPPSPQHHQSTSPLDTFSLFRFVFPLPSSGRYKGLIYQHVQDQGPLPTCTASDPY